MPVRILRIAASILLAAVAVRAEETPRAQVVPLEGLDPVLLVAGMEVSGDPSRALERGRFRYVFASDETRDLFAEDPERFEIQLGGHCATMGAPTEGNPDRYTVHNGRIYVFGSGRCRQQFLAEPARYAPGDPAPAPKVAWHPAPPASRPGVEALVALSRAPDAASRTVDWPQWGGPRRDFVARGVDLAESWPAAGPPIRWRRELGEGYSAIAVRGGRLYTMLRRGDEDVVVALDAATGRTVWEHAYAAPLPAEFVVQYGPGPHATPLVTERRVFTAGGTAILRALDRETGKLLWSHDLYAEYGGTLRVRGYAASPLAWRETVIVPVGSAGHGLMAFRQDDGTVVWSSGDFKNSCSSPILVEVDGTTELVAFLYGEIVGADPTTGAVLWTHPHPTDYGLNVSTPTWGDDRVLVVSSAYGAGARALRLASGPSGASVDELWYSRRLRIHFGNAVRAGDFVYGSSGDSGPALFTALDVRTGEPAWRDRQLARASLVVADGKLVLLDEDGTLVLASPSATGLEILGRTQLFDGVSWTVPSIAGGTLYARDRRTIVAVDLAPPPAADPAPGTPRDLPGPRAELRSLLGSAVRESDVTVVTPDEPGERLRLEIEVVERESGRPIEGARIYAYQTDARGDYAPEATEPGGGAENPRLFAFARTDDRGRVTFRTVLPAPYRGTRTPRHVHVKIDGVSTPPYGTAIYLDRDPGPDAEVREEAERGLVVIAPVEAGPESLSARARIRVPTRP